MPPERLKVLANPPKNLQGLGESIHGGIKNRQKEIAKVWFGEEMQLDIWALGCMSMPSETSRSVPADGITGTLFLCASGQHPYDSCLDADAEGELESTEAAGTVSASTPTTPLNAKKTGYAALKGTVSWSRFREERGEGTLGHTTDGEEVANKGEVERMMRAIKLFTVRYSLTDQFLKLLITCTKGESIDEWDVNAWQDFSSSGMPSFTRLVCSGVMTRQPRQSFPCDAPCREAVAQDDDGACQDAHLDAGSERGFGRYL